MSGAESGKCSGGSIRQSLFQQRVEGRKLIAQIHNQIFVLAVHGKLQLLDAFAGREAGENFPQDTGGQQLVGIKGLLFSVKNQSTVQTPADGLGIVVLRKGELLGQLCGGALLITVEFVEQLADGGQARQRNPRRPPRWPVCRPKECRRQG